ncbi:hypothetical protein Syun_006670 [Stephania yunnanensis]|uniref:Uncharacterized protein n=1 Tax=Stephania yunnanensis TaxID=152371 RepID=A0AAP0PZJ0_9MAGN
MEWMEGMRSGDGSGERGVAVMREDAVTAANLLKEFTVDLLSHARRSPCSTG